MPAVDRSRTTESLLRWFHSRVRDVPWRGEADPYRVWIAEVMAQQTRMATVRERYDGFLERFPDVFALASAELDEVLKAWEGLGYYARARNLHLAAGEIVRRHGGRMPQEASLLRELPGVGAYTAGAIASIAFGRPEPAVDGNVRRVLSRVLDLETPSVSTLEREARALIEAGEGEPGDVNQALMDLGGELCTPTNPGCDRCPLATECLARRRGTWPDRPGRRVRRELPHHTIAVAVVRRGEHVLIGRRPKDGLLGGLWEFPGGKVEPGESPESAARRELREEMCIEVELRGPIAAVEHAFSHFRITLHAFEARWVSGRPCGRAVSAWKWVRPAELSDYAFPAANRAILTWIKDRAPDM